MSLAKTQLLERDDSLNVLQAARRFNHILEELVDIVQKLSSKDLEPDFILLKAMISMVSKRGPEMVLNKFIKGGYLERFSEDIITRNSKCFLELDMEKEMKLREQVHGAQIENRSEMLELMHYVKKLWVNLNAKTQNMIWEYLQAMYFYYLLYRQKSSL